MVYGIAHLATKDIVDFYKEHKGKRFGRFGLLSGWDHGKDRKGNQMYVFMMEGSWFSYLFARIKLRNEAVVFKYR